MVCCTSLLDCCFSCLQDDAMVVVSTMEIVLVRWRVDLSAATSDWVLGGEPQIPQRSGQYIVGFGYLQRRVLFELRHTPSQHFSMVVAV